MDSEYRYDNGTNNPATSFRFGPKVLAASLYQLSPPEVLTSIYLNECCAPFPLFTYTYLVILSITWFNYNDVLFMNVQDLTLGLSLARFSPLYNYDLIKLTKEKYGSVPRVFIVSEQDHAIVLDVQNFMIKNNPPKEVKVINGSDHAVMLSRPVELFSHFQDIAEKYS